MADRCMKLGDFAGLLASYAEGVNVISSRLRFAYSREINASPMPVSRLYGDKTGEIYLKVSTTP